MSLIIYGGTVAKPNYSFEKRQRELLKKKKKAEKAERKAASKPEDPGAPGAPEAVPPAVPDQK